MGSIRPGGLVGGIPRTTCGEQLYITNRSSGAPRGSEFSDSNPWPHATAVLLPPHKHLGADGEAYSGCKGDKVQKVANYLIRLFTRTRGGLERF
jgi:hypothetical protein